jgi:CheY-like chemotaxis protein
MGGNITVESEPDKGSQFAIDLQVRFTDSNKESSTSTLATNDHDSPGLKTSKILLIEDNADNQRVVSTLLHNIGIEVDIANHGAEGLEKFINNHYDIIFVDCFMPRMDGFEFTRLVREHEASNRTHSKAMLIGLTAGAYKQNIEKCFSCGMDDVITKPFYRIDIYKRVLGFKTAQKMLEKVRQD